MPPGRPKQTDALRELHGQRTTSFTMYNEERELLEVSKYPGEDTSAFLRQAIRAYARLRLQEKAELAKYTSSSSQAVQEAAQEVQDVAPQNYEEPDTPVRIPRRGKKEGAA